MPTAARCGQCGRPLERGRSTKRYCRPGCRAAASRLRTAERRTEALRRVERAVAELLAAVQALK